RHADLRPGRRRAAPAPLPRRHACIHVRDAVPPPSDEARSRLRAVAAGLLEMLARSLQALLTGLIDYAGLFPPASLSMEQALANYARYREGEHAWMLGRFVVPAARAAEVPADVPTSVIGVDEVKAETEEDVHRMGREAHGRTGYVQITA